MTPAVNPLSQSLLMLTSWCIFFQNNFLANVSQGCTFTVFAKDCFLWPQSPFVPWPWMNARTNSSSCAWALCVLFESNALSHKILSVIGNMKWFNINALPPEIEARDSSTGMSSDLRLSKSNDSPARIRQLGELPLGLLRAAGGLGQGGCSLAHSFDLTKLTFNYANCNTIQQSLYLDANWITNAT